VLTKRADRLLAFAGSRVVPPNVWLGVSVESAAYHWRIDCLRRVDARVRFLSIEPLLASLGRLDLHRIDWVIVGGESGPHARAMDPDWVREIREQCLQAEVPFFFKQWGGRWKHRTGRELDGRIWDEMPAGIPIPCGPVHPKAGVWVTTGRSAAARKSRPLQHGVVGSPLPGPFKPLTHSEFSAQSVEVGEECELTRAEGIQHRVSYDWARRSRNSKPPQGRESALSDFIQSKFHERMLRRERMYGESPALRCQPCRSMGRIHGGG
jgi:hypothetical protein